MSRHKELTKAQQGLIDGLINSIASNKIDTLALTIIIKESQKNIYSQFLREQE